MHFDCIFTANHVFYHIFCIPAREYHVFLHAFPHLGRESTIFATNAIRHRAWEPFCHQSPEQLKMSPQKPSESHFATKSKNSPK